jgi:dTDP-L-rhamnose 4-epimerase
MYDIRRYMEVNTVGTATLLDVIVNDRIPLRKLVVASSMSIYGEGLYECKRCGPAYPQERRWLLDHTRMENGKWKMENGDPESVPISNFQFPISNKWEQRCPRCQDPVAPVPTDEDKPLQPNSPYAIGKKDTEELALSIGRAYGIPTVALRYFNVYGSRQALSNPYTGAAAIFATRLLNGNPPIIYEDGLQRRDFVHVSDIVQANLRALEREGADYQPVNVGTGRALSILDLAQLLSDHLTGGAVPLQVTGQFRAGDIRHCYANITRAREWLGYEPQVRFEGGIAELVEWVREQTVTDPFEKAAQELQQRGLTR